ncbi:unnamed protein product [Litomosoides sigmodontis]|uniref:Uncharacterized protein n=1 Tax=Litomosoides sigmodontis TaxID=42156 RepID=A0A3P6T4T8_LITSI|nr:unnamed protein product [Litomosoides sigmodontis]
MDDGWPDSMLKFGDTPELLNKKNSDFDREFMNFGKRFLPFERTAMSPNKKIDADVDVNPFSREFLNNDGIKVTGGECEN